MASPETRSYAVRARSTDTHGRVMCSARNHYFIVDGPVQNGAPGEAVTPAELFLTGIAACGVELVQAIAKTEATPLQSIHVDISGTLNRSNPVRTDVSVFNAVHIHFHLTGVSAVQGTALIDRFKGR